METTIQNNLCTFINRPTREDIEQGLNDFKKKRQQCLAENQTNFIEIAKTLNKDTLDIVCQKAGFSDFINYR